MTARWLSFLKKKWSKKEPEEEPKKPVWYKGPYPSASTPSHFTITPNRLKENKMRQLPEIDFKDLETGDIYTIVKGFSASDFYRVEVKYLSGGQHIQTSQLSHILVGPTLLSVNTHTNKQILHRDVISPFYLYAKAGEPNVPRAMPLTEQEANWWDKEDTPLARLMREKGK